MRGWRKEHARHSLAARGVRTSPRKHLTKAKARVSDREEDPVVLRTVKVPPLLYHGTSKEKLANILKTGLLVTVEQNPMTVEMGHGGDTIYNVSFANTVQDAIFFSVGASGWTGDQAILEIDVASMPDDIYPVVMRRPLFGKKGRHEFKIYTSYGIPPKYIKRVLLREHVGGAIKDRWVTKEEYMAEQPELFKDPVVDWGARR